MWCYSSTYLSPAIWSITRQGTVTRSFTTNCPTTCATTWTKIHRSRSSTSSLACTFSPLPCKWSMGYQRWWPATSWWISSITCTSTFSWSSITSHLSLSWGASLIGHIQRPHWMFTNGSSSTRFKLISTKQRQIIFGILARSLESRCLYGIRILLGSLWSHWSSAYL